MISAANSEDVVAIQGELKKKKKKLEQREESADYTPVPVSDDYRRFLQLIHPKKKTVLSLYFD